MKLWPALVRLEWLLLLVHHIQGLKYLKPGLKKTGLGQGMMEKSP